MSQSDREEVLITNIPDQVVDVQLATTNKPDHWRIIDYTLEDIGPGKALLANGEPDPLTVRLDVAGHYRVSLISRYSRLRIKCSDDRCYDVCEPVRESDDFWDQEGWYDAEEVLWREVDLTGQDLIIAMDGPGAYLLAIRLVPVEATVDQREVRWPMVFSRDLGVMRTVHNSPDDMFESLEHVPQDSCVKMMIYGCGGGDVCGGPTQIGTIFGETTQHGSSEYAQYTQRFLSNLKQWEQWGINPIKAMIDYAHDRQWEIYLYIRLRPYGYVAPLDGPRNSKFFAEHPEFRMVGPNGEAVASLSVAYPEVREHLCQFYAELAALGPDGISPCFIRGCPVVLYDPPVVESFQEQYGEDPRQLPESDPRWLDHTAEVVTLFMRELKDAIGPHCKLGPMMHGTAELNRHFGMDIATWVAEGIVDDLFIMGHKYDRCGTHSESGPEDLDYQYFEGLAGRENVRMWPIFYMWKHFKADPARYCAFLQECLDEGADGYGFWDAAAQPPDMVGNIWHLGNEPRPTYKKKDRLLGKYDITTWCGFSSDKYTPREGW